jgi:DNA-binding SARP family transcriptional activator
MTETGESGLKINLFGRFQVWWDRELVPLQTRVRGKAIAILKILLSERGQPFTQDQLVELLFTDLEPKKAVHNVHARISELRRAWDLISRKAVSHSSFLTQDLRGIASVKRFRAAWIPRYFRSRSRLHKS